jgi:DNA modification methylase
MVNSRDLEVQYQPLVDLKPRAGNPRRQSRRQIRQIAASIEEFGFTNPLLIDDEGGILAGHGRVEAAQLLGIETAPTIRLSDMTEPQRRAYVLADNKLAQNAGWDQELLALELHYLTELELDFDVTITGFEAAEIDVLIEGLQAPEPDAADRIPAIDGIPPASRPGDLWQLGRHRLLCGDATQPGPFTRLMAGKITQMVFIDPPCNVPIDGHLCGLGQVRHAEFAMAAGEMSEAEFMAFLETVFRHLVAHSADGSIHYVCMDWRHLFEVLTAGRKAYAELKNLCVWNKTNGGMGSLYRSKHELVLAFKNGAAPHINNVELGRHGRYRTNVWDYPGVNSLRDGRLDDLEMHPTVKPVALVADAILDYSKRGGIVLDCFAGSGTTLIAAERSGRRGYAMEIDPKYVDTAIRRWQTHTGGQAVHAVTGESFTEIAEMRAGAADSVGLPAASANSEANDAG